MKKFLISMAVIWSAVALGLFFAWWTISRNLTNAEVTEHANKVARELQIPWTIKFSKVQPRFGGDFRLVLKGITATNAEGVQVLFGQETDLRMPWTMFFTRNPGQVNVTISGVKVADWKTLITEVEKWLDARRQDSTQQVSLPQHVVDSRFNLRMSNVSGKLDGIERRLDKLFLLNMNPRNPSAFEMVLPWSFAWRDASVSGVSKILGEYRVSQNKIDLHYYLKNRVQVTRGANVRSGENSIEGKGFYHPRMGLFSTLTAKDDWLSMIGDIEWTREHVKLDVPKFALSHELLLDLLPFDGLRSGSGPYQGAGVGGAFQLQMNDSGKSISVSLRTKSNVRLQRPSGLERLELSAGWSGGDKAHAQVKLMDRELFNFSGNSKGAVVSWGPELFVAPAAEANWLWPDMDMWDLLSWFPWKNLSVSSEARPTYLLKRDNDVLEVDGYTPWTIGPRMTMVYPVLSGSVPEWVASFSNQSIEKLFALINMESPIVPGFAFSGGMQYKQAGGITVKLAWKGPMVAMLARSSCKVVMQDNPAVAPLLNQAMSHQLELTYQAPMFEIKKWTIRGPDVSWDVKGSWANEPIKCSLQLLETRKRQKPRAHEVQLN